MLRILNSIDSTVSEYNMLSSGDTVVVGVSGGADSMLLLKYLIDKRDAMNLQLIVANVEHGIRGDESKRDSLFVKDYCQQNNVRFECLAIDAVNEAKKHSMSVEEYSRKVRYDFFNSFDADKIATAHNLSDSVETVLFRLSRGTSLKGCCGIPAVRGNIIRPLINCSSGDIRSACNQLGIDYVVDSTNLDTAYSRNFVRHQIIPDFQKLNTSFEKVMSRFICSVNEDNDYLDKVTNEVYNKCLNDNILNTINLQNHHISIIKRVIVKYLENNGVGIDDLHLNGICSILNKNSKYQLKDNLYVVSNTECIRLVTFNEITDLSKASMSKKVLSVAEFLNNCELLAKEFDFYCDCDKINGNVSVRCRVEGDNISLANRNCTKSLKKLYNELKINIEDRPNIPVLVDDNGVIGVVGYCCDERVKVDKNTNNVLLLKIRMEDSY